MRRLRGTHAPPLVLATGYAVLLLSWAMTNPPFASPDEPAHYLRAIAVGGGSFAGAVTVDVPAGLGASTNDACNAFLTNASAACLDDVRATEHATRQETAAGTYPPLAYLLPGVVARRASDPQTANRLARLTVAVTSAVLVASAALLLWQPAVGVVSLLGMAVATTPMVIFVGSIESNSALEASAGVAFAAALLRLSRSVAATGWTWFAVAATGSLLVLSRSTGVLWLALDVLIFGVIVGASRLLGLWRSSRRAAVVAATLVLAAVANRAWEWAYGTVVTTSGPFAYPWREKVGDAVLRLDDLLREWVGRFGWLDSFIPLWATYAWLALGLALVGGALIIGRWRERAALLTALAGAVGAAIVLSATLQAGELGGDVQARHLMPALVAVPLLAGEIVSRSRLRVQVGRVVVAVFAVTAALQWVGWYWNARRHATGSDGPLWFVLDSEWAPPVGWPFWCVVVLVGAALMLASARLPVREPGEPH